MKGKTYDEIYNEKTYFKMLKKMEEKGLEIFECLKEFYEYCKLLELEGIERVNEKEH